MNEIKDESIKKICANEVIQIGAIKLDSSLNEIDKISIYIKPIYNEVIPRIANLTGITNEKLENCDDFSLGMDKFLEWIGTEDYKILAWSSNDYKQLKAELSIKNYPSEKTQYMFKNWIDFQRQFCDLLGLSKSRRISLDLALDLVGTSFKGKRHDALSDSRNTAYLYKISRNKEKFKKDMAHVKSYLFQKEEKVTILDLLGKDIFDQITKEVDEYEDNSK